MLRNDMIVCNLDCKRYKGSKAIPNPFVVEVEVVAGCRGRGFGFCFGTGCINV